jgi:hypothetical protein
LENDTTMTGRNNESSPLIDRNRPQLLTYQGNSRTSIRYLSAGKYGTIGSMSIAVNFLTGPAMLQIPSLFQKSGLIPTTLCIICTCFFTTLGCLHFANAISKLPGNHYYSKEVEYSDAFHKYWPNNPRWVAATEIVFFLCVTCLNVSSLVDSAQVFDVMLAILGGRSHALRITTSETAGLDWVYESWDFSLCDSDEDCVPFSDHEDEGGVLLTAGYIINALFFMPLALMDLQVNKRYAQNTIIYTNNVCVCVYVCLCSRFLLLLNLSSHRKMLSGR